MRQFNRRALIGGIGLIGFAAPAILRAQPTPSLRPITASQAEGPFYPIDDLPSDQDTDLVRMTGVDAQAQGQVSHVTGVLWSQAGDPVSGALIEIWQCDHTGRYLHRADPNTDRPRDAGFQGYGRVLTDSQGGFRFRTIRPVAYTAMLGGRQIWRAPHIHLMVSTGGVRRLTTQLYVEGDPHNETDLLLNGLASADERAGIVRPYTPADSIEAGALQAHYDLIIAA